MKVLHILNTRSLSGAENVVADICMMFRDQIDMAYCSPQGEIRNSLEDRDVAYLPVNDLSVTQLKKVINEYGPDIIHAHDVKATFISALVKRKIPLISHLHVNQEDMRKISLKSVVYLLSTIKAKKIIMVSNSCRDEYYFNTKISKKTTILKNILYKDRIELLTYKDINKYDFDFVFLGRLSYQKNPERVAKVASMVLKKLPNVKFGVIGTGELKESMIEIFKKEKVNDRVTFTGKLQYPYQALKSSKCMLMCSRFEGTPIAALEAMYLGLPIISTPTDGLLDLIDHGDTGFLSDEDLVLSQSIITMLTDENKRHEFSVKQIEKFNLLNDSDGYKNQLNTIYESVL